MAVRRKQNHVGIPPQNTVDLGTLSRRVTVSEAAVRRARNGGMNAYENRFSVRFFGGRRRFFFQIVKTSAGNTVVAVIHVGVDRDKRVSLYFFVRSKLLARVFGKLLIRKFFIVVGLPRYPDKTLVISHVE